MLLPPVLFCGVGVVRTARARRDDVDEYFRQPRPTRVNVMFGMGASGTTADSGEEEGGEGGEQRHDGHADDDRRRQH